MKKLMTSTIIILPLILLAILLVSGAIMSLVTHIYVETIEFSEKDTIILVMDDENNPPTYSLSEEINILPLTATNRDLTYSSGNEDLIKVNADGVITPLFYGETYITVQSKENKAATATRKVIVTDDKVHKLTWNCDLKTDLYENETLQLAVNILPEEAVNKIIIWSSSDQKVLEVSENGFIKAVGNGKAKVIVTSDDNAKIILEAEITCHKKLTGIKFDNSTVQTIETSEQFPEITFLPSGNSATENNIATEDVKIAYVSSEEQIATIDEQGQIKFSNPGSVTITVTATDFKGTEVTGEKTYVSTCGNFTKPIFSVEEVQWNECHPNEEFSAEWLQEPLENTYAGNVTSIKCHIDGEETEEKILKYENHKFVFGNDLTCNGYIEFTISAQIYDFDKNSLENYQQTFKISKTPIESGKDAKVTYNGTELIKGETNKITISDIGETITLNISGSTAQPLIGSDTFVGSNLSSTQITLTGKTACEDHVMKLSIGVSKYILSITVDAQADTLTVLFNGDVLSQGKIYKTLLNSLTFTVVPSRSDGRDVTDTTINFNDGEGTFDDENITVENITETGKTISFGCGKAKFDFTLRREVLTDFGMSIRANTTRILQVESVKNQTELLVRLPSNVQDQVTLEIDIDDELLGGVGDNETFQTLFDLNTAETKWTKSYNAYNNQIIVNFKAGEQEFNKEISLSCGDLKIDLRFVRISLSSIAFTGFDSANSTDIYLGHQQVRVFAKHSYYDGKQVDYFKIPINAKSSLVNGNIANLEAITWQLYRYVGETGEIVTSQIGNEVTYNNVKYTIYKNGDDYKLKDSTGKIIVENGKYVEGAEKVIWVDTFSESGFARIYFGNFGGLSESDVYNDYFGNFGDSKKWSTPAKVDDDKGGGITVEPSVNAYSFLRVEAGDGADGGKNCHFNFNVLQDDSLVNVFNATGYLANNKVVLHNNLYGEGELGESGEALEKAKENDLILNPDVTSYDDSRMTKAIIYGNGYQVNLKVLNDKITEDKFYNGRNTSHHTDFDRLYNVTIKGCNPVEKFSVKDVKIYLSVERAYYCDLQYYSRMNRIGTVYLKNTVLRNIAEVALLLWRDKNADPTGSTAYLENIVVVNSVTGIGCENGYHTIKIKGLFDVLNYQNKQGFANLFGGGLVDDKISTSGEWATTTYYDLILGELQNFVEWHGEKPLNKEAYYANLVFYLTEMNEASEAHFTLSVWNDAQKKYVDAKDNKAKMSDGSVLQQVDPTGYLLQGWLSGFGVHVWTYGSLNSTDGASVTTEEVRMDLSDYGGAPDTLFLSKISEASRDMSKLFSKDRYIRLLCEYKDFDPETNTGVKNDAHILWHIQQVYRDTSLIEGRESDHIKALKDSLKEDDGWDKTWPDNSKLDDAFDQAANINKILSTAILPKKQEI